MLSSMIKYCNHDMAIYRCISISGSSCHVLFMVGFVQTVRMTLVMLLLLERS